MAKLTKASFIESLKEMSIKEVMELVEGLKEEFGIDPTAVAVAASSAGAGAEVVEEKTEFKVVLVDAGANKVNIIKVVKEITGLGLMDAKKITETTPATLKEGVSKDEAAEIVKKLQAAGATAKAE